MARLLRKCLLATLALFILSSTICEVQTYAAKIRNIKGKVTDSLTGKGIQGVVVSDGKTCVLTDSRGRYRIKSECKKNGNVFVIVPSEYEIPFGENNLFNAYRHVDGNSSDEYNFILKARECPSSQYKMLFLGDPQVMSVRPHSGQSWKWMTDRLKTYGQSVRTELYQIILGDMVVNEIEVEGRADEFISALSTCSIKSFCIPGNHDHIQKVNDYDYSISKYSEYFGPYNYAVNIGKFHYIFFDTPSSTSGITEDGWDFIQADLKYVPIDSPIVLCTHCPMTQRHGGMLYSPEELPHYQELIKLLEGRDVSFWYGHIHFNSFWSYDNGRLRQYAPGVKSLESHVVGRGNGSWACSGEIGRDGSPRGIVEATINDETMTWRYISFDEKYPDDMNVYVPGQFEGEGYADDNALYCNVYLWDEKWNVPQLWVNGVFYSNMTRCVSENYTSVADPLYAHFFSIWKQMNVKGFRNEEPRQYDNSHLFSVIPPKGAKDVQIRVTDRWGRTYIRNVSLWGNAAQGQ